MGWDTEITILAENLNDESEAKKIAHLIFEKDANHYGTNFSFVKNIFRNEPRKFIL